MIFKFLRQKLQKFNRDQDGAAAIEFAFILPLLLIMLLGLIDVGRGIVVNKKIIGASQIVADLLTRLPMVSTSDIDDAIIAGRLAIEPYPVDSYGVDIVSIRFEGDDATPTEVWRETRNMTPYGDALALADGLGEKGEGVLVVAVGYNYQPVFANIVIDTINMQEVSVFRGRRSAYIRRE